ncbi:MAG TPA: DUF2383 domain-containing protein [Bacteriovoracaceae bacterium]|nr:DUF2383 domain-containing protein [Bacteriovoracaceae bacterium]
MKLSIIFLGLSLLVTSCGSKEKTKQTVDHAQMEATSHSKLDDLIRGEMTAVETYDQVLGKIKDKKEKKQLKAFRDDHKNAVEKLTAKANTPVKDDARTSGAWGTFAEAWTGGAKLFGNKTAVRALKQGEEHGYREYEQLLNDEKVSEELKNTIRTELMPKQKEHITALEKLI